MSYYKQQLASITTVILDFDGVLTNGVVYLMPPNEFVRTMHVRDSYAIQHAARTGINIAVITGGNNPVVAERMKYLGITDVYLCASDKQKVYQQYKKDRGLTDAEILYMGDDLPDYAVMRLAGLAVCPQDAAEEIKSIAHYVSPVKGGEGCVREILEQLMKMKGTWFTPEPEVRM
jgi:3-deoxy-D-manno-octulosonate 8-phosphate phosphatase (KDO 8-P phosphatase)